MIVILSTVRSLLFGLLLTVAFASPVLEPAGARMSLLKRSSLQRRTESWRMYPQFNEQFQENYVGPDQPVPNGPDMEYAVCIYKWVSSWQAPLQRRAVGGVDPID